MPLDENGQPVGLDTDNLVDPQAAGNFTEAPTGPPTRAKVEESLRGVSQQLERPTPEFTANLKAGYRGSLLGERAVASDKALTELPLADRKSVV